MKREIKIESRLVLVASGFSELDGAGDKIVVVVFQRRCFQTEDLN